MSNIALSQNQIEAALKNLEGWQQLQSKLRREFEFKNFDQAFAFMTEMALFSAKKNHHPEWSNIYNKVEVSLLTHDLGGISQKDIDWAEKANKIYQR